VLVVFLVLFESHLSIKLAAKKIDAFHDAFDRFGGETGFVFREVFVPEALVSFASPVSSPASALRFHFFEWLPKLLVFIFRDLAISVRAPNAPNSFELTPCGVSLSSQDVRLREGSRLFCSRLP
jgi:hypothetical protein